MPEEFDYLRELPRDQQLVAALTSQSAYAAVSFFVSAAEDETWTSVNQELMSKILTWVAHEFAAFRVSDFEAEQTLRAYYLHRQVLQAALPLDVVIEVAGESVAASGFLYGIHSPRLRVVMREGHTQESPLVIDAGEVTKQVFAFVDEFICTGEMISLWREPLEVMMQVLQQAQDWRIAELEERCTELIGRYLTVENYVEMLLHAHQHGMARLQSVILAKLNELELGIEWRSEAEHELTACIHGYQERAREILLAVAPLLTRLSLRADAALNPFLATLLPLATQLRHLDLDGTSGCHEELLDLISPTIEGLSLQRCPWIQLPWARKAVTIFTHLHELNIGANPEMSAPIFVSFLEFAALDSLDLRHLGVVNENNFDYFLARQPDLYRLNLSWCIGLSDETITHIKGKQIKILDLSHTRLADAGLQAVGKKCPLLQQLLVEDCTGVTEAGLLAFVRQALNLRFLDARGLGISAAAHAEIRQVRRGIELLA